jgi:hypothetical protein
VRPGLSLSFSRRHLFVRDVSACGLDGLRPTWKSQMFFGNNRSNGSFCVKTLSTALQILWWIVALLFAQPVIAAQGVAIWVIFDRGRDMLRYYGYYGDPDVQAFAQRNDLALLMPFHCRAKSYSDINVDPTKGLAVRSLRRSRS